MTVPKYKTVKMDLTYRIKRGEFDGDFKLPSEHQISATYGVSRVTARKVFDEFEKEGRISRRQGKGTYLVPPVSTERRVAGLRTIIEKQGFHATVRLVAKEIQQPDDELAAAMDLEEGTRLLTYKRVYLADGIPVMYAESHINYGLLPGVENYDFNFISYSEVLANFYASNFYRVERTIHAQRADEVAPFLDIAPETPIVLVNYLLHGEQHGSSWPVEHVLLYARTDLDQFRFYVT